ncbi:hypothetical protein BJ742DRAFT_884398 [Cladochytrium replicatum]|nr:hypothetical protein BJ742DRAFT_884398 [Cladochytrium replicatum]
MATGQQSNALQGGNGVSVYERSSPFTGGNVPDQTVVQVEPPTPKESAPMSPAPSAPPPTQQAGLSAQKWLFAKIGFASLAAILLAVAIYTSVTNSERNAVRRSTEGGGIVRYDSASPPSGLNGVELTIKMIGFDPETGLLKLNINLNPDPLLASSNFGGISLGSNRTVAVSVNDKTATFVGSNSALLTPSQDVSVGLLESSLLANDTNVSADSDDPVNYPIDRYDKAIVVSASITDTSSSRSSATFTINAYLYGVVPGFAIRSSIPEDLSIINRYVNTAWFGITITRGNTVIIFAIFVGALMWIFLSSKPEPPVLSASTALLFALPAFRNVQPGAPPVGSSSDLASFYWAIAIAALCAFSTLMHFFKCYKGDKPVTPKKEV